MNYSYIVIPSTSSLKGSLKIMNLTVLMLVVCLSGAFASPYTTRDRLPILTTSGTAPVSAGIQQTRKVTGTVSDAFGPVAGANVIQKGTTNGTITDANGNFAIEIPAGAILYVSFIGYVSQEIAVRDQNVINVSLDEDTQTLEEVVVVGYGIQKKVNLTGSVSSVSVEDIQDTPASNLSNALVGKIAGVLLTQSGGKPGASAFMTVRAEGTWNDTEPLYVIDGIIRDKFAFDGLDASEVENLSVLKDGASAAIYGARAANGVVLVTTKKGKRGKPVIAYTGSVGVSDATMIPKTQNAYNQAFFECQRRK